jgi:hypothetical protein
MFVTIPDYFRLDKKTKHQKKFKQKGTAKVQD